MSLGAYQITVLPGSKIRFKDHQTGQESVVILDDEIEVQAVRDYTNLRVIPCPAADIPERSSPPKNETV